MRILWLAPEPPVAPLSGGRERARRMLAYLAARHEVHLVTFAARDERAGLAALRPAPAAVIARDYPAAWSGSTELVCRAPRSPEFDAVHLQGLHSAYRRARPRECDGGTPDAPRQVLDLHDVPEQLVLARTGGSVLGKIRSASELIVVSEADRAAVASAHPGARTTVVPNGVDVAYWSQVAGSPRATTLLFPAALNWEPNSRAARRLVAEIFPRLRAALPQVRLVIAGRRPTREVRALAGAGASICVIADPADMRPLFAEATAVVVPTEGASGTRLKILQALAAGRPVISTPNGAAGLGLQPGRHLLVANLVQPFVEAVLQVLTDVALRDALVWAGRAVIPRYDWQVVLPALDTVYPP
jgi:glycosyltransferase involved in cell wall biosynthesis